MVDFSPADFCHFAIKTLLFASNPPLKQQYMMTAPKKDQTTSEIQCEPKPESNNLKLNTELSGKLSSLRDNIQTNGPQWKVFSRLVASNFSLRQAAFLDCKTRYIDEFDENIFYFLRGLIQTNSFLDTNIKKNFADWYSNYHLKNSYYRLSTLHSEGNYGIEINEKIGTKKLEIDFRNDTQDAIFSKLNAYSTELYSAFFPASMEKTETKMKGIVQPVSLKPTGTVPKNPDGNGNDDHDKQSEADFEWTNRRNNWVVHSRNKNQKLFCRLYEAKNLVKDRDYKWKLFSALIASSFSLWRAAPLCDNQRNSNKFIDNTFELLSILNGNRTNTIGTSFLEDIYNEEWVVGYYLRNSYYRLLEIGKGKKHNDILNYDYFYELLRNEPQKCWDKLHKYSEELFLDAFA
jgi:hypothetical protein